MEEELKLASGDKIEEEKNANEHGGSSGSSLVTSDGTYATQSVFSTTAYVYIINVPII